ncbi:MAG: hypothetical protein KGL13_04505 [Gammaproteobacteria bacterium]|nr:hypothetical protein [Gammaproteobacteria bacterium]MDE2345710.1 hypothetical protein [Gammaproteobacteria bacterium]
MKRAIPVFILIALLGSATILPAAWADDHGGRHDSGWNHGRYGDRDGHWEFGWHDGRPGWLWVVGGAVLLYSVTHPAPAPRPPTVIVQPAVPAPSQAYWYYCPATGTYYPYVQSCPGGWQMVAASPPPPPPNR